MQNVRQRMETVLVFIKKEQELLRIQKKIQSELNERIEKSQREYFLKEELKSIKEELGMIGDAKSSDYQKFKEKIEELESHLNFKKSELNSLITETQKEEEFLVKKSEEFAALIDERLLSSYKRIRNNSANGLAVVGIERGAPKGSYFTIPAQKLVEIAQRKKIIIDEHSGKILVDDELVSEENAKMEEIIKF